MLIYIGPRINWLLVFVPDKFESDTYVLVAHNYIVCY